MKRLVTRLPVAAALAVLAASLVPAAEPAVAQPRFDLDVQFALNPEMTAQLQQGDLLRVVLRPEIQYGERSVPGEPVTLERPFEPGMMAQTVTFRKALEPDQIYRLEMHIVRASDPQNPERVRYISALDKLPRRPVDNAVKMRLFLGDQDDGRDNHVMVVRDTDGVYRVMIFTA